MLGQNELMFRAENKVRTVPPNYYFTSFFAREEKMVFHLERVRTMLQRGD